jgi:diguanylate cyclase (GGDEF)-like protein
MADKPRLSSGPQSDPLGPDGPSDRVWGYVTAQAAVAFVVLMISAGRPAPIWTTPTTMAIIVPIFVCAVAAVGVESRREAVHAGESGDGVRVDSCGMILLVPALLLSFGCAIAASAPLAFMIWKVLGQPLYRLAHELGASALKVSAAALFASQFSSSGDDISGVFAPIVAGATALWVIDASTSATLEFLAHGRVDLTQFPGSLRSASRFVGVSLAFILLYVVAPPLTLVSLPLVALVFSEQRIRHLLARRPTDDKTGLATSGTFTDRLNEELQRAQRSGDPVSVVLLDLDHFKSVNTRFGHLGGDQALAQVAEALMTFRRRTDLVARWGGDELVWLMPGCPRAAAASAAESVRRRIAESVFTLSGQEASLTVSVGVATGMPGDSYADLFSRADNALYRAKEAGRNACSVDGVADPTARPLLAEEPPVADRPRGWS